MVVKTQYAPAQRSPQELIQTQVKLVANHYAAIKELYDAVSEIILIVNHNRQIVFFNQYVPQLFGVRDPDKLYGMRPGEAIGCIYACNNTAGCGTSKFCSQCGAVNAILSALANQTDLRECRLQQVSGNALDLLVKTSPLNIDGQSFSIVAATDISHEKRRRMLEHIFFHDIMNTTLSINILSLMLKDDPSTDEVLRFRNNIMSVSKQLMEEIKSQKEFLAAEFNELKPNFSIVEAAQVTNEITQLFAMSSQDRGIELVVKPAQQRISFKTDHTLLKRVLGNMMKNALEASSKGKRVTMSYKTVDDLVEFSVHNQSHIPEDVQLQIFQRSFSTKGEGRGLGTYSMKLLSERYLKGIVDFQSSEVNGTTFSARYPL